MTTRTQADNGETETHMADERLLTPIPAACTALGNISRTTLYELVDKAELVKVNIGRRGFITTESLTAYVDRLAATPRVTA
jgi:hypothetical protein